MRRTLFRGAAALIAAMLTGACSEKPPAQPIEGVGTAEAWPSVGGAADEASYSRLDQIGAGNVGNLGLAWSLDLPGEVTLEAVPLAIDGTLYFTGTHAAVYAVDAATAKLKWKHDPQTWKHSPEKLRYLFAANRGVAYADGKIFAASLDCKLSALDAETGEELWSVQTTPQDTVYTCSGAPRAMNDKVIIGNGGGDLNARGYVTAYDAETGRQLWRFHTVPGAPEDNAGDPAMERAAETWSPDFWKTYGGGGTVWNGMTFDPELNRVYIGVGNAGPYDPELRSPGGGDNLYLASIVALDADTGEYVWHYQENPRESWDYKSTPNIVAATLTIEGEPRDVLMHAPTNGFFYVLDRRTGELLSAGKTTEISWAKGIDLETGRPIENENIRYEDGPTEIWPGMIGGHNWQPMAYNPRTGLVYIPIQQLGIRFERTPGDSDIAYNAMGLKVEPIAKRPGDGHGFLVAWDPVAQDEAWRIKHDTLWNGGALTTAGDLVFQGTADGWLNAYDARSGERLWRFDAGLGIISAPMTYSIGGKQYVSILVGYGGTSAAFGEFMNVGWKYGAQPRRLLTFALDGNARLPETAPPNFTIDAVDDPDLVLDPADVAAGRTLTVRCSFCHGIGLSSTGTPGPDLRESRIALDLDSFSQFMREAPSLERGMPKFDDLSDEQLRQLHAYIRARARQAIRDQENPPSGKPRPIG